MDSQQGFFLTREVRAGLLAPLNSLKFLKSHKWLLFIGVAPQFLGLIAYGWLVSNYGMNSLVSLLSSWGLTLDGSPPRWLAFLFGVGFYVLAVILYALIVVPFLNVVASPLFDILAEKAYEERSLLKLPQTNWKKMALSMFSELIKLIIIYSVLLSAWLFPPAFPIGVLFSVWLLGWDQMDRTLALMNYPLRSRFGFGFKHILACVCLGIWFYIPLLGTLLAFTFAPAGAIAVADIQTKRDIQLLKKRGGCDPNDASNKVTHS